MTSYQDSLNLRCGDDDNNDNCHSSNYYQISSAHGWMRVSEPLDDECASVSPGVLSSHPPLNWFVSSDIDDNDTSTKAFLDNRRTIARCRCANAAATDSFVESRPADTADDSDKHTENEDNAILQTGETRRDNSCTKRVQFASQVQIREYAVTVGDAPTCQDSCPLTLDWYYCETTSHACFSCGSADGAVTMKPRRTRRSQGQLQQALPQEKLGRCSIRRLSLEQRRRRVAHAQNWSPDQVRAVEIERVLQRLDEAMDQHTNKKSNNNNHIQSHLLCCRHTVRNLDDTNSRSRNSERCLV